MDVRQLRARGGGRRRASSDANSSSEQRLSVLPPSLTFSTTASQQSKPGARILAVSEMVKMKGERRRQEEERRAEERERRMGKLAVQAWTLPTRSLPFSSFHTTPAANLQFRSLSSPLALSPFISHIHLTLISLLQTVSLSFPLYKFISEQISPSSSRSKISSFESHLSLHRVCPESQLQMAGADSRD